MIASGPLVDVGECDLSADVDFVKLSECFPASRFSVVGPYSQRSFLESMGIQSRLKALSEMHKHTASTVESLRTGVHRLVDDREMGQSYKVLSAIAK